VPSISIAPASRLIPLGNKLCLTCRPLPCTGAVSCRCLYLRHNPLAQTGFGVVTSSINLATLFVLGEISVIPTRLSSPARHFAGADCAHTTGCHHNLTGVTAAFHSDHSSTSFALNGAAITTLGSSHTTFFHTTGHELTFIFSTRRRHTATSWHG